MMKMTRELQQLSHVSAGRVAFECPRKRARREWNGMYGSVFVM